MSTTCTDTVTVPPHTRRLRLHLRTKDEPAAQPPRQPRKKKKWLPLAAEELTFEMAPFDGGAPSCVLAPAVQLLEELWHDLEADEAAWEADERGTRRKKKWSRPRATAALLDRHPVGGDVRGLCRVAPSLPPKIAARWAAKFEAQWSAACNRHLPSAGRTPKPEPISLKRRKELRTKATLSNKPATTATVTAADAAEVAYAAKKPTPRYALNRDKINTPHDRTLAMLLLEIQERDITPEDYDVLLRLDEVLAPKTLSRDAVQRLPTVAVTAKKAGEPCPVCLDAFRAGELCTQLPCEHEFHKDCIERWLSANGSTCPLDGLPVQR